MDSTVLNDPFVYVAENILTPEKCSEIIDRFEKDKKHQHQGVTAGGIDIEVKNSIDLMPDMNPEEWKDVEDLFHEKISLMLDLYINHLSNAGVYSSFVNNDQIHLHPPNLEKMMDTGYQIQRTRPGKGYTWHHDAAPHRILTFILYLNTVDEGWTQFYTGDQVSPSTGRGVIFPATWTYYHQGYPPLQTKYIMTGWLHEPH
tara:strand:+ start:114 stop:716 length:603 start_codon:yes stop_codon:yes gene_type:complete